MTESKGSLMKRNKIKKKKIETRGWEKRRERCKRRKGRGKRKG